LAPEKRVSDINVRLEKPVPTFGLNASAIMRSLMMTETFSRNVSEIFSNLKMNSLFGELFIGNA